MKLMEEADLPYTLFVEPQEVDAYRANWPTAEIVDIGASDRGVSYARNQILRYAAESDSPWVWMIDDDITRFTVFNPVIEKTERTPVNVFFQFIQRTYSPYLATPGPRYAMLGMTDERYVWLGPDFKSPCNLSAAVAFDTSVARVVRYDESLPLLEDLEMILKLWSMGYLTGAAAYFGWNSPAMGKNPGGLLDTWADRDLFRRCCEEVSRRYPMFYQPTNPKNGEPQWRLNLHNVRKMMKGVLA